MFFWSWDGYFSTIQSYLGSIKSDIEASTRVNLYSLVRDSLNNIISILSGINTLNTNVSAYFEVDDFTLRSALLDVQTTIDNAINPLSTDNRSTFDTAVNNLYSNTFVGTVKNFSNEATTMKISLSSVNPNSHIYVNTLGVNFFGVQIPSQTIDIDMSWYAAYRTQTFSILRAFIYLGYFIIVIRALPSLLGGTSAFVQNREALDIPVVDNITVNDSGEVIRHTTTKVDGNVRTTQIHEV